MTQTNLTPAQLLYAASSRCPCGAGLAYPFEFRDGIMPSQWECSALLTGTGGDGPHTAPLPFAFYEVKSEGQPSARGATTRPDEPEGQRARFRSIQANARVNYLEGVLAAKAEKRAAEDAKMEAELDEAKAEYEAAARAEHEERVQ
jgi:hypothetical protein